MHVYVYSNPSRGVSVWSLDVVWMDLLQVLWFPLTVQKHVSVNGCLSLYVSPAMN